MIDELDGQILKSGDDYARNKRKFIQYLKYAEIWQSTSLICSYAAFLCDILLIVMFIIFFIKYCKTMKAMLAAFISTNTSGIPPTKANPIDRTFPPLFKINLPEEDQIVDDLEDSSIYHHHIEHFFHIFGGSTVFSLISESAHRLYFLSLARMGELPPKGFMSNDGTGNRISLID